MLTGKKKGGGGEFSDMCINKITNAFCESNFMAG